MANGFKSLAYTGSVKSVYQDEQHPAVSYFGFSNDYSVFDWGKMPNEIAGKGRALALMGGYFFRQLSNPQTWQALSTSKALSIFSGDFLDRIWQDEVYLTAKQQGLRHHFLGWVDDHGQPLSPEEAYSACEAPLMKVRRVEVNRPRKLALDHYTLYDYESLQGASGHPFLIPLEVIFRFGITEGSSLSERLSASPQYYAEMGLSQPPQAGVYLERPVIEFFTKLEPKDRFLSVQEAFLISGLDEAQFAELYHRAVLVALWLFDAFASRGIELWDGKLEFAWSPEGIMLVDSIGPDELRLKQDGVHLSKESIRQFYRDSDWERAIREAKLLSQTRPASNWRDICIEELKQTPAPLSAEQQAWVNQLYGAILCHVTQEPLLSSPSTLGELVASYPAAPVGVV